MRKSPVADVGPKYGHRCMLEIESLLISARPRESGGPGPHEKLGVCLWIPAGACPREGGDGNERNVLYTEVCTEEVSNRLI